MAIADRTVNGESRDLHDSLVAGLTSYGGEFRATLVRLTRHQATFEIYSPQCTLRVSEVLSEFRIVLRDRTLYAGRAVVGSLVNTGIVAVCQVSLDEQCWTDVEIAADPGGKKNSGTISKTSLLNGRSFTSSRRITKSSSLTCKVF